MPSSHTTFPNTVPHPPVTEAQKKMPFRHSAFQSVIPHQPISQVQAKHYTSFPNSVSHPTATEVQPVAPKLVKEPTMFEFAPVITSETNARVGPTLEKPMLDTGDIATSKPPAVNEKSNSKSKMNLMKKGEQQQHKSSGANVNHIINDAKHPCPKPLAMLNGGQLSPAIDTIGQDMSISSASSINSTNVFQEGNIFQVTVSHVESPSCIYINTVNDETTSTKNLLRDMNRVYNHPSRPDFSADFDAHIAVHDRDKDIWMRGHRIQLHCSDDLSMADTVTAHLIDVGNTVTVPESECADLLPKFKHPAKLAHPIRLAKVYPVPPQTDWSRQMLDELKELLKHAPTYKLTVISEANEREIPSVTLSIVSEGDDLVINDLLVSLDLAVAQLPEEQNVIDWEPVTTLKAVTELWNPEAPEFQPNSQSGSTSSFKPPEFPLFEFGATAAFAEVATKESTKSGTSSSCLEDISYLSESPPEEHVTPPIIDINGWDSDFNSIEHIISNLALVNGGTEDQAVLDSDSDDDDDDDDDELCYEFMKSGLCDRPGCTKNHSLLHAGASTLRPQSVCTEAFTKLKLPEIGTIVQFHVTEVKSVNNMFVILTSENVSMGKY
ncbi:hypothetical protein B566_EDAN009135 [Ephemera danica]|nr:hypothetical protein B566_EDAN009135 [Ephemera danica]